jgi:hypothetical protein
MALHFHRDDTNRQSGRLEEKSADSKWGHRGRATSVPGSTGKACLPLLIISGFVPLIGNKRKQDLLRITPTTLQPWMVSFWFAITLVGAISPMRRKSGAMDNPCAKIEKATTANVTEMIASR